MKELEFNLIYEPWIRVVEQDGMVNEVNLMDVLINAHNYRSLAGEMAAQDIAVLRCLIALVHTVVTSGESWTADEDELVADWKKIWDVGCFPESSIRTYLTKWKDRFWLFHPVRPFYQVPKAVIGTKNTASKLNGAVSESNNKARLFSQISGIGKERMSYPESARWLLFLNGFDDCAAKQADKSNGSRGSTVGWLGKLGLVYVIGENLFETIMLNMPMLMGKDMSPWGKDIPTWELEEARSSERETIEMPDNLAALYTLQSRRILLRREGGFVVGYSLLGGDAFEDINALNEPMTLWIERKDKTTDQLCFRPLLHERDHFIWRDFAVLAVQNSSRMRPGIVNWCDLLRGKKIFPKKRIITLGIVCVRYDSSQSSSITDSFSDDVMFHMNLLSDAGKYWRDEIDDQIAKIEKAAYYLELLVNDLRRAEGLDSKLDSKKAEGEKELLYQEIDAIFREWLLRLDSDQDSEERNELSVTLEQRVRECVLRQGRKLIDDTGETAYIGRNVEIKKNVIKHYSSSEAYKWFKNRVWKLYQYMKGDENGEE